MTLRDLTPSELRVLQTRCEKERTTWENRILKTPAAADVWNAAFSHGLKAGLEFAETPKEPK